MPNIKHAFASSIADGGDGTLVQPSNWNAEHALETYLDYPAWTDATSPSAPGVSASSASLRTYAETMAGKPHLEILSSFGRSAPLGRALWYGGIGVWSSSSGSGITNFGLPVSTTGTVTTPAASIGNLQSMARRVQITSASPAASAAGVRTNAAVCYGGGAAVSTGSPGGYFLAMTIGTPVIVASSTQGFAGLRNTTAVIAANTQADTLTTSIGFGFNAGASVWSFLSASAASPASMTSLTGFDVSASAWHTFYLWCPPATSGSCIYWEAHNLHTGAVSSGSVTSPIPAAASLLSLHTYIGSNGAGSKAIAFSVVYLETDW